jgi:hypothetical protein
VAVKFSTKGIKKRLSKIPINNNTNTKSPIIFLMELFC